MVGCAPLIARSKSMRKSCRSFAILHRTNELLGKCFKMLGQMNQWTNESSSQCAFEEGRGAHARHWAKKFGAWLWLIRLYRYGNWCGFFVFLSTQKYCDKPQAMKDDVFSSGLKLATSWWAGLDSNLMGQQERQRVAPRAAACKSQCASIGDKNLANIGQLGVSQAMYLLESCCSLYIYVDCDLCTANFKVQSDHPEKTILTNQGFWATSEACCSDQLVSEFHGHKPTAFGDPHILLGYLTSLR